MVKEPVPAVSVVVPVYNGRAFLGRCLETLFAQDVPAAEILVVDDGSTDGSPELVRPPARLLKTGGRRGAGYARNLGARAASGEILFFTDSDVEVPPDWIRKGLAAMREHGVPCGGGGYAGPVQPVLVQQFAHEELVWRRRNHHGYVQTLVSNNLYCRRDLFLAAGGFPENYQAASSEDMEFSWKVSRENRLWWDAENGVFHNFTGTLKSYCRQQYRFARDAVPMLLGDTALLRGETHHGKQLYAEVLATGLMIPGLMFLFLTPWPLTAAVLLLLAVNLPFLVFLARRHGVFFAAGSLLLILSRNIAIIAGTLEGMMLWILDKKLFIRRK